MVFENTIKVFFKFKSMVSESTKGVFQIQKYVFLKTIKVNFKVQTVFFKVQNLIFQTKLT